MNLYYGRRSLWKLEPMLYIIGIWHLAIGIMDLALAIGIIAPAAYLSSWSMDLWLWSVIDNATLNTTLIQTSGYWSSLQRCVCSSGAIYTSSWSDLCTAPTYLCGWPPPTDRQMCWGGAGWGWTRVHKSTLFSFHDIKRPADLLHHRISWDGWYMCV